MDRIPVGESHLPSDTIRIMEERKNECDMRLVYRVIRNP
jgi:hypothetical protein